MKLFTKKQIAAYQRIYRQIDAEITEVRIRNAGDRETDCAVDTLLQARHNMAALLRWADYNAYLEVARK